MALRHSFSRKLPLAAVGIAVVVGPVVMSFVNAQQMRAQAPQTASAPLPTFEVASIRPHRPGDLTSRYFMQQDRLIVSNATPKSLIASAYNVKPFQVSGGPNWIESGEYDIEAKVPDSLAEELQKLPSDKRRDTFALMVQSLLADRFKLRLSHDTKELPVYALVVAKSGPKLHEAKPGDTYPNGMKTPDGLSAGPGFMVAKGGGESREFTAQAVPIANLVRVLSGPLASLDRRVLDKTGLKGNYDIHLHWMPDQSHAAMSQGPGGGNPGIDNLPPPDSSGPSPFTALQEQLGLKLESTKGPVEVLVIDHIERPSEN
jgi:uncharacterized protein (TIGR03435 family)